MVVVNDTVAEEIANAVLTTEAPQILSDPVLIPDQQIKDQPDTLEAQVQTASPTQVAELQPQQVAQAEGQHDTAETERLKPKLKQSRSQCRATEDQTNMLRYHS